MLAVREFGEAGAPAVLLLHGFLGSSADWDETVPALGPGLRSLAPDLPGHGASLGLPDEAFSVPGAVRQLVAALDRAGIDSCDVVGYSMGGRVALRLALDHPDRCRRLVLVSSAPGIEDAAERQARAASDDALAERLEAGPMAAFVREWYRQPLFASLHDHPDVLTDLTRRRVAADRRELARALRGLSTGRMEPLWHRLPDLVVPTLALAGERDAKYVTLAADMARMGPTVRTRVLPGAGHALHLEAPQAFTDLLNRFLTDPS